MKWLLSAFADEAGGTVEEQIEALKRAGLHYIDIRGIDGFNITTLPLDHAREVKQKLDAVGIKVGMYGSPIGKIDIADDMSADLDKLNHLGDLAPILGCNAVRIFSYYNKEGRPHEEWQQESLNRLGQLRDLAEQRGLVLYHENERHIFGDYCKDVLSIAKALRTGPEGTFRLIFDFDNYNQSDENVWENWQQLRDLTDGIHLKDSKDHQHVPVGQGTGSVREILADALQRGWHGPLTVEPHLTHSGAVAATGPSGVANQEYSKMSPADSFHAACQAATNLLQELNAPVE
ncbi:MAG: sugar phosphate isomerase/epimerase [Abitibacteriaceae bacterium]|nr:sugar phosphate isomerase/epimerase [Abditibacteriaceae bacterium]